MQNILSEMAGGLTGIRLITIVDVDSMMLASWESPDNNLPPEGLGFFIQQIKGTINEFKQSSDGFTKLDDVILNTSLGYILLKPIGNGACFLAVDAPRTVSLGSIRTVCDNYTPRLEAALPGYKPLPQSDGMETTISQG